MVKKAKILLVDDDVNTLKGLKEFLESSEYKIFAVATAEKAIEIIKDKHIDILLTDLKMPGKSGMDLMEEAKSIDESLQVILFTAYGSVEKAVEAMKKGAYDFITKPVNLDELEIMIKRALELKKMRIDNIFFKERLENKYGIPNIIGNSKVMEDVYHRILAVAPTNANVLIEGESGTGKELIANAIHINSIRKNNRFVPLHCAALAEGILESELFGHEKGAFTGAVSRKIGRFEYANGGTLFLDEINELNLRLQVKLLRVLQEKTFERVGSTQPVKVDVRILAATNKNLEEAVKNGYFREDLYYRLKVVTIYAPQLRKRKEDIPILIEHFLKKYNKEHGNKMKFLTGETINILKEYDWPGNIRELENTIESIVILSKNEKITKKDIPENIIKNTEGHSSLSSGDMNVKNQEKELILKALKETGNNKTKAAEILGISRKTIHRKIKEYHLGT
ncbi:MAG: sigma-54-dependent Fis family transcriptional regulator [Candidatus Aureabacteria bacterium]|nr:sigma-54-dependent Fis family transcriptional regulator [Candidatus Auribacterota bacterium]